MLSAVLLAVAGFSIVHAQAADISGCGKQHVSGYHSAQDKQNEIQYATMGLHD